MHLAHYLGLLHRSQTELARAFREIADAHGDEPDVAITCQRLAEECEGDAGRLRPFADRYSEDAPDEPERLHSDLFRGTRSGGLGLLRDLHDLYLMAAECDICWTVVGQAAAGARDKDLLDTVTGGEKHAAGQLRWLRTRMKQAAPQALVVAE
ncbi:hypothetical protein GCM10009557_64610 [Virgisporangium ochraceum]|uniref:Molybdopterin oxidoreductase n=1 Tax=Virgisporangium ochraceum TaxID=65505 RepID=A0A8J4EIQ7_9ACTN|nr:hypothetical protein [Virgisporangium ochraceum]GIJ73512.1 hypothetical protein Voc01_084290 [Virgisporangium ochraceum]